MAIVELVDLSDLVQVLPVLIVVRVQGMVAQDLQPILFRHMVNSIRDHAICLLEHALDVGKLGILLDHALI